MLSPSYVCACTVSKGPTCFYQVRNFNPIKSTATARTQTGPYTAVLEDTWMSHVSLPWLPYALKKQLFFANQLQVQQQTFFLYKT